MNQCLHCSELCGDNTVFCNHCRLLLLNQLQQEAVQTLPPPPQAEYNDISLQPEAGPSESLALRHTTLWQQEEYKAILPVQSFADERAHNGFSYYERECLPEEDQASMVGMPIGVSLAGTLSNGYTPHSSLPEDVLFDSRYETIPVPQASTRSDSEQDLDDTDIDDENKSDPWANQADPLVTRHLPDSAEAMRIDEEDNCRLLAGDEQAMIAARPTRRRRVMPGHIRMAFIVLAILGSLALLVDGTLVSLNLFHQHHSVKGPNTFAFPLMCIMPGTANPGQVVLLHISHFSASTHVLLTHDIQEAVRTDTTSPLISVEPTGEADVHILVE